MSLTFPTTTQKKPSGITALPNQMKRPAFGTLHGFDAQGGAAAGVTDQDILDMSPLWWLDADVQYVFKGGDGFTDQTVNVADGQSIYAWHDRSGNTRHFGETIVAYQPVWRASGTNGKPYVDYTAANARVYNSTTVPPIGSDIGAHSTPITIYMVIAAITSATQHGKKLAAGTSYINYGHTGGGVFDSSIYTTISNDGMAIWNALAGRQAPQSLTTQIIQIEGAGTSVPVLRINGGSGRSPDGFAYGTGGGAAQEDDWTALSTTTMFAGNGATFLSYDFLAIGNVTHDADTVFSYLGDKYDITVEAVS